MANSELSPSVHQRSQHTLPPSPRPAPWLVYKHGKDFKFQTFYNISDPMNTSYRKYIPELSNKRIWQKPCHQGWLVILYYDTDTEQVLKYGDCFLWNPTSLETIQLPNFLHCVPFKYNIVDCVLSSPPRSSSGISDDSMVYMLYDGGQRPHILIYCHPGAEEWRKHEFVDMLDPRQMFYFKGKLYIMCLRCDDVEIEIHHGSGIGEEEILGISDFSTIASCGGYEVVAGPLDCFCDRHWIASFGEVFYIEKLYFPRGIYHNCVTTIKISKLDFSTMTWVEVNALHDTVLFLSDSVQLCCLASELGLTKGCVYFTQEKEMSLYKYDLEDNSILLCLPCPDLPIPWLPPSWLMISTTDHMFGKGEDIDRVVKATDGDEDGEKEHIEEARPWVMLNDDLVWLVSNYLHTLDYIHLRALSKKYRSIMKLKRSTSNSTTRQTTNISPWLVSANYDKQVFSFVNPMHKNENYLVSFPELLKGSRIRFSKGGWLLMSKGMSLFFYNPFNRSIVKLPDLPDYIGYYFSGISFSSPPHSTDCVVFAVYKYMTCPLHILFIKKGDVRWTYEQVSHISLPPNRKHLEFELSFNNPVFYNGAFYCLGINGTLAVSRIDGHVVSWEVLTTVATPKCKFIYKSFLVECQGKLLSVLLGHLGKWVRIFRLNDKEMVWDEIKHLGNRMLFLSNTSSISAIAPTSLMKNKIYFPRLHQKGVLYYSLDTGMYYCFGSTHCAKDYRDSKENLHCSWIEPNWLETADDQYLNWLSNSS